MPLFTIHVVHHPDKATAEQLCRVEHMLGAANRKLETIMPLIDDLQQKMDAATASIQKNSDLDDSIINMLTAESQQIKDLKAALDAAGTDPDKLQALSAAMDALIAKSDAEVQKKSDAITANTQAA